MKETSGFFENIEAIKKRKREPLKDDERIPLEIRLRASLARLDMRRDTFKLEEPILPPGEKERNAKFTDESLENKFIGLVFKK